MPGGNVNPIGADASQLEPSPRAADDQLNSWKDIAVYLNRDVRTVRRWEKNQALPVHRHQHQKSASVYAFRSELDAWWANGMAGESAEKQAETDRSAPPQQSSDLAGSSRSRTLFLAGMLLVLTAAAAFLLVPQSSRKTPTRQAADKIMLVVLPFQNLTGDPAQDFIADGFTEEMSTQISQLEHKRLGVIARTSAMAFKGSTASISDIGRQLHVDYVLEGSVRRWGDRVRVTAQLIQAGDQTHVWAENYESARGDVLRLQSEIARDVSRKIRFQLLPPVVAKRAGNPRPVDPQAHELYLKGRQYLNQRTKNDLREAVQCFRQAVVRDPEYAAAHAALADAYNLVAFYGFDPELDAVSLAKISADKALKLDSNLAAGHAALAYTEFMWQQNWPNAEKEFQIALDLDSSYIPAHQWYALYLAAAGRMDEALSEMQYAQRLDPLSPAVQGAAAYVRYLARDYEGAIAQANRSLQLHAGSMAAHAVLGWAYTEQKKYPDAIRELTEATKLSGGVPVYKCSLARAYALSGDVARSKHILAEVEEHQEPVGSGTAIASTYLALGNSNAALHWLEQSAFGDIQANWLRVDPAFDAVGHNPRFLAVVDRLGQPILH